MSVFYISPSQVETFLKGCQRKWAWRTIGKVPSPQGKGAALGDGVHKELESHLKGGEIDHTSKAGKVASVALPYLPHPKDQALEIERTFRFEMSSGVLWTGRVDLSWMEGDVPVIHDHKTSRNIDLYAKTAEDLADDIQALTYAYEGMSHYKSPIVDLSWLYLQTEGTPKAKPVRLRVYSEQVAPKFLALQAPAKEMIEHRERLKGLPAVQNPGSRASKVIATTFPPNLDHCNAFGGCPYRAYCSDVNPLSRIFGEGPPRMDLDNFLSSLAPGAPDQNGINYGPSWGASDINPPEQAPHPATPTATLPAPAPAAEAPEQIGSLSSPEQETSKILGTVSVPEEPKKRGPGRPKKTAEPAPAPSPAQDGGHLIDTLYVNCFPVGVPAELFERRLLVDASEALHSQGVADYRLVDYGKGAPALVEAVCRLVAARPGISVVVDSRTPEGGVCLSALSAMANAIVRGF